MIAAIQVLTAIIFTLSYNGLPTCVSAFSKQQTSPPGKCLSSTRTEGGGDPGSSSDVVYTLLLCRHGDSVFNGGEPGRQETFTGWMDVPLSNRGVREAKASAAQVSAYNLGIDACFTSVLQRAQLTAHYCLWAFSEKPHVFGPQTFVIDWRLSERHYGALQGLVKAEAEAGLHGHNPNQVRAWRRSWDVVPPLLDDDDPRRQDELRKFASLCGGPNNVPRGESLQQVAENRIRPFLTERLIPILKQAPVPSTQITSSDYINDDLTTVNLSQEKAPTGLVVAHANSLRALIGVICEVEKHDDPDILSCLENLRLPTGQPLVLKFKERFDGSFQVCDLNGSPYSFLRTDDRIESKPDQKHRPAQRQQLAQFLPVWPLAALPNLPPNSSMSTTTNPGTKNQKKATEEDRDFKDVVKADDSLLVSAAI